MIQNELLWGLEGLRSSLAALGIRETPFQGAVSSCRHSQGSCNYVSM